MEFNLNTMKYNKLDDQFCEKFWTILNRMSRLSTTKYKDSRCEKEEFVRRTLHKWFAGKQIATVRNLKTKSWSGGGYCAREIKIPTKQYLHIANISYYLGHGEELIVRFVDASTTLFIESFKLNKYEMKNIEFVEIDATEFDKVLNLFVDDRDDQEFEFTAWNRSDMTRHKITLKGKDRELAKKSYKGELLIP